MKRDVSFQIATECRRLDELLSIPMFNPLTAQSTADVLFWTVITEMMIHLDDLCYHAEKLQKCPIWTDDMHPTNGRANIRQLVKFFRDGLCHAHTWHRNVTPNFRMHKGVCVGKGCLAAIGDIRLTNDYVDDVALFIGGGRLYFRRHLLRVIHELQRVFELEGVHGPLRASGFHTSPKWPLPGGIESA